MNNSSRPLALVTGASSGIGLEIARRLAAEGHDLVLVARSRDRLEALAGELRSAQGVVVHVLPEDLAQRDGADRVAAELRRRGLFVDVLVNNAGFGLYGRHVDTALEDEQQMIDVNITTLTRLTKLLLPGMVKRGRGRVLDRSLLFADSAIPAYIDQLARPPSVERLAAVRPYRLYRLRVQP